MHNVVLPKRDEALQEGSRIHVNGCIRYRLFVSDDDTIRQEADILANEFYLCDQMGDGRKR